MRVLAATGNAGKVRELRAQLERLGLEVVDLSSTTASDVEPPEETGDTFGENALLKATFYRDLTGLTTIADDSGLEVAILGGRPGVRSARYAESDTARVAKLLGELEGVPASERSARFVCALAMIGDVRTDVVVGVCEGHIRLTPVGTGGFGFDPVFVPEGATRTFAELSSEEKSGISHRGRAIRALAEVIGRRA